MVWTRIAGVLLPVCALFAFAQPTPLSHLTIRVLDAKGAPIAGAQIRATSGQREVKVIVDRDGEAAVELRNGGYEVDVVAKGFLVWSHSIELLSGANQSIDAKLEVPNCSSEGMNCDPVVEDIIDLPIDHPIVAIRFPFEQTHVLPLNPQGVRKPRYTGKQSLVQPSR